MSNKVVLKTSPAVMTQEKDAWVVQLPRFGQEGNHFHTYGLLTPYFKGLTEGKLMATKCVNGKCPIDHGTGELWLPSGVQGVQIATNRWRGRRQGSSRATYIRLPYVERRAGTRDECRTIRST